MAYEEMEQIRKLGDKERTKKVAGLPFAKEALEFTAESLDSKLALPMGHYLVNGTGSSEELWMLISNAVEVLQCCDRCMEQVDTGVAELGACKFVCKLCTTDHQLFESCKALNLSSEQWKSITRSITFLRRKSGVKQTCCCLCVSK